MESLIKNSIHRAIIEGYSSDGCGVCRIDGRAVFVRGALKGEEWDIKILSASRSAVYGRGEALINASDQRQEPSCPVFGKCGGCDLMHMSYEEELRFKLDRVNEAIGRIGGLDFKIDEIIGAESIRGYRNKAIFAVGGEAGAPKIGFFRRRSHDIVPVSTCDIQSETAVAVMNALRQWCEMSGAEPYNEETGKGKIRHLFVRTAFRTGQLQAVVVSAKGFGQETQSLVNALREACPKLESIVLCVNKSRGNTVLTGELHTLWGSDTLTETLCGLDFELSPFSFFQINPTQAERLYSRALEYAAPSGGETILDLYCGAGTISLCLSRGAKRVIGAEIVPQAVENAKKNAARNGIENAEFICADAGEAAKELAKRGIRPDAVVVDPPRKGLSPEVIETVSQMSPSRIVYVSCDPATLARDLARFDSLGWGCVSGTVVDMFPKTANMETVVLLSKLKTGK